MKGWYGDRMKHSLASKGIKSYHVSQIPKAGYRNVSSLIYEADWLSTHLPTSEKELKQYNHRVQLLFEDIEHLKTAVEKIEDMVLHNKIEDWEAILQGELIPPTYGITLESRGVPNRIVESFHIVREFDVDIIDSYVRRLIDLYNSEEISEATLRGKLYDYEIENFHSARGMTEQEETEMAMDMFAQVQKAKRERIQQQNEHEIRMREIDIEAQTKEANRLRLEEEIRQAEIEWENNNG